MTKVDPNKIIKKDPPMRYGDGDFGNAVLIAIFAIILLLFMIL